MKNYLGNTCCICGIELTEKTGKHLDHQHCFLKDKLEENGNGLIRGYLCRNCNLLEGKIWNSLFRYTNKEEHSNPVEFRIKYLERIIDYYKNNHQSIEKIIHNSEYLRRKISKRDYNKLQEFGKSKGIKLRKFNGKLNKQIYEILKLYNKERN